MKKLTWILLGIMILFGIKGNGQTKLESDVRIYVHKLEKNGTINNLCMSPNGATSYYHTSKNNGFQISLTTSAFFSATHWKSEICDKGCETREFTFGASLMAYSFYCKNPETNCSSYCPEYVSYYGSVDVDYLYPIKQVQITKAQPICANESVTLQVDDKYEWRTLGGSSYTYYLSDNASFSNPKIVTRSFKISDYHDITSNKDFYVKIKGTNSNMPDYYAETDIKLIKFSPAPPTATTITPSLSCPNKPTGSISVSGITSVDKVRWILTTDPDAVGTCDPSADSAALSACFKQIRTLGTAEKGANIQINDLPANSYTLFIMNPGGTKGACYTSYPVTVGAKPALAVSTQNIPAILCNGGTTTLSGNISAGVAPYTLKLEKTNTPPQEITQNATGNFSFTGLTAGNYTLTISDACDGKSIQPFALTEPPAAPGISLNPSEQTNPNCSHLANGEIKVRITNAAIVKVYKDNALIKQETLTALQANLHSINTLGAGTYRVEAFHPSYPACEGTSVTHTLTPPTALGITINSRQNVLCNGGNTGSVTLTASGASGYNYTLKKGTTTVSTQTNQSANSSFVGLTAGTYTLQVGRAVAGCNDIATTNFTITEPAVLTAIASVVQPVCHDANSSGNSVLGSISVVAGGGTAPYSYSWKKNGYATTFNQASHSNVGLGSYQVTVTDANNCTLASNVVQVNAPVELKINNLTASVIRCRSENATLSFTTSGGTGAISLRYKTTGAWATLPANKQLPAGNYSLQAKDSKGCEAIQNIQIPEPATLSFTHTAKDYQGFGVSCLGSSDGEITLVPSGGHGGYQYKKGSTGTYSSQAKFTNLPAGSTVFYVKDAQGCEKSVSITLTSPSALSLTHNYLRHANCSGSTGSVGLLATGGAGTYQYRLGTGAWQNQANFNNLSIGNHIFWVKDANGCSASYGLSIQNTNRQLTATALQQVTCLQKQDGRIQLAVSGAPENFEYRIKSGSPGHTGYWGTSKVFNNLAAGNYQFEVKDDYGCVLSSNVIRLTHTTQLTISTISKTLVPCSNSTIGKLTLQASGGLSPYKYQIDDEWAQNSPVFNSLTYGTYQFLVEDANGCEASYTDNIAYSAQSIQLNIQSTTGVPCENSPTGSVSGTASGGLLAFRYRVDGGAWQTSGQFTGLVGGAHQMEAHDTLSNCSVQQSFTIATNPSMALQLNIQSTTGVPCENSPTGSVSGTASGGLLAFRYRVDGGAWQTSGQFTGLVGGAHQMEAHDTLSNCSVQQSFTIATNPSMALQLTLESSQTVFCQQVHAGGALQVQASGGSGNTAAYRYKINSGNWQKTGSFGQLIAGDYTITVKDTITTCQFVKTFTVAVAAGLQINLSKRQNVFCDTDTQGFLEILASGASGIPAAYRYQIADQPWQSSHHLSGLTAGIYTVKVKDTISGCSTSGQFEISIQNPLVANLGVSQNLPCVTAQTGSLTLMPSGASGSYEYRNNGGAWQTSAQFNQLDYQRHQFEIKDSLSGCIASVQHQLSIENPIQITLLAQQDVPCLTASTGRIQVQGSGALENYRYQLNAQDWQKSNLFQQLPRGTYTLSVQDSASTCMASIDVSVGVSNGLQLVVDSVGTVPCATARTAWAAVKASGALGAYQYQLDNGSWQTSPRLEGLTSGVQQITVRDTLSGCTQNIPVNIGIANELQLRIDSANSVHTVPCNTATTAKVSLLASGSHGAYQYQCNESAWQNQPHFENLTYGQHTLRVRDSISLCQISIPYQVSMADELGLILISKADVSCDAARTGHLEVQASGAFSAYQYSIDQGITWQHQPRFDHLGRGNYLVSVRDTLSACQVSIAESLQSQVNPITLAITEVAHVPCAGAQTGRIDLQATGALGGYQYNINDGPWQSQATFTQLSNQFYIISVRDTISTCLVSVDTSLHVENVLELQLDTITTVSCTWASTAFAEIGVSGAYGAYQYALDQRAPYTWQATDSDASNIIRLTNLTYGAHRLVVRDSISNCTAILDFQVTLANPLSLTLQNQGPVVCDSALTGFALVAAQGGLGNYSYQCDGGPWQTSPQFNRLSFGAHQISVRDSATCTAIVSLDIVIENPLQLQILSQSTSPCANVHQGRLRLLASGGIGTYQYRCDTGAWQDSPNFEHLPAGQHTFYVRDTSVCHVGIPAYIETDAAMEYTLVHRKNVPCNDARTGSLSFQITSGTAPYVYSCNGSDWQNMPVFDSLVFGRHQLQIKDAKGCILQVTDSVFNDGSLSLRLLSKTSVPCQTSATGSLEVQGIGGDGAPYMYRIKGDPRRDWQTATQFHLLSAQLYEIEVRDPAGCIASTVSTIEIGSDTLKASLSKNTLPCVQAPIGEVLLSASGGGGAPYVYRHLGGSAVWQDQPQFKQLAFGQQVFEIKDASACVLQVRTHIDTLRTLFVSAQQVEAVPCQNAAIGQAVVNIKGGTAPFRYRIDGGVWQSEPLFKGLQAGNHRIEVQDQYTCTSFANVTIDDLHNLQLTLVEKSTVPCADAATGSLRVKAVYPDLPVREMTYRIIKGAQASPWQTSEKFDKLTYGQYIVEAKDQYNCSVQMEVELLIKTSLELKVLEQSTLPCQIALTGKVLLEASAGGGAPYLYRLGGSAWQAKSEFIQLSEGKHAIYTKDAAGCLVSGMVELTSRKSLLLDTIQVSPSDCQVAQSGALSLQAQQGAGAPYLYRMGTGTWLPSGVFKQLTAGVHRFEARDAAGCLDTLDVAINNRDDLKLTLLDQGGVPCLDASNGFLNVSADLGSGAPYRYKMDQGGYQNNGYFKQLTQGDYTLYVIDRLGCTKSLPATVVQDIPAPELKVEIQDVSCFGGKDGKLTAIASKGVAPYTYQWDLLPGGSQLDQLAKGTYALQITDAVGCVANTSAEVSQPLDAVAFTASSKPLCYDRTSGQIYLVPQGGTSPYQFSIGSKVYPDYQISDRGAGTHLVKVTDAKQCTFSKTVNIVDNPIRPSINFLLATNEYALDTLIIKEVSLPMADSVHWEFDEQAQIIAHGASPQLRFAKQGQYWVRMTAFYDGCDFTLDKLLDIKAFDASKGEVQSYDQGFETILVFPNPNDGVFTVDIRLRSIQDLRLHIYDMNGKSIWNKDLKQVERYQEMLAPKGLTPGIYILQASTVYEKREFKILVK